MIKFTARISCACAVRSIAHGMHLRNVWIPQLGNLFLGKIKINKENFGWHFVILYAGTEMFQYSPILGCSSIWDLKFTFSFIGKSILQVPDTGTWVLGNTTPFLRSSIVSSWITPARSKEREYHIFRQYWYTRNVPVFTNTGMFQYLGPEVYFFQFIITQSCLRMIIKTIILNQFVYL